LALSGNDQDDDDINVMLLSDIRDLLASSAGHMTSQDLCNALAAMAERPWGEWRHGKPISQHQLARRLKPFGIATRNVRAGHSVSKSYDVSVFADPFARYLKNDDFAATPLQPPENKLEAAIFPRYSPDDGAATSATPEGACSGVADVADRSTPHVADKNAQFPEENSTCSGVADETWDAQGGLEL
jgi:hypothetical protein